MKNFASSLAAHAFIVAFVLLLGLVVHKVIPVQRYRSVITLPMDLPAPIVRPAHTVSGHAKLSVASQPPAAAPLAVAAPSKLRVSPERLSSSLAWCPWVFTRP
jgi:hypothetical protein